MANIKVIVNGAKGKMGEETVKAVQKADGLTLVGQTDLGDDLAQKIKDAGAEQRAAAAAAAGQGFANTLMTGPSGAPAPSTAGGKATLGA